MDGGVDLTLPMENTLIHSSATPLACLAMAEAPQNVNAVVNEAGSTGALPSLPVINDDVQPETYAGHLPADNVTEPVAAPNR